MTDCTAMAKIGMGTEDRQYYMNSAYFPKYLLLYWGMSASLVCSSPMWLNRWGEHLKRKKGPFYSLFLLIVHGHLALFSFY